MTFAVSAIVDSMSNVAGIRHSTESALALALEYASQGFADIRIVAEDASYTLEQFRMLVE